MLGIECLHCYKTLAIPEWVNTDDYDGEIVCKKCKARLAIKFTGSEKPAKYKLIEKPPHTSTINWIVTPDQKEMVDRIGDRFKSQEGKSA